MAAVASAQNSTFLPGVSSKITDRGTSFPGFTSILITPREGERLKQGNFASEIAHLLPWRGQGGGTVNFDTVEFDKQLDKISLWVEKWDHEQRCKILEGLLIRTDWHHVQFLWTVLQPSLHRDFMYTAKKEFPALPFQPLSTHTSRKLKDRMVAHRIDNYHRIPSAYPQSREDVKHLVQETGPARVQRNVEFNDRPQLQSETTAVPERKFRTALGLPRISETSPRRNAPPRRANTSHKFTNSLPPSMVLTRAKTHTGVVYTPGVHGPGPTMLTSAAGLNVGEGRWKLLENSPASLRFVEMPVRRHIQAEIKPSRKRHSIRQSLRTNRSLATTVDSDIGLFESDSKIPIQHLGPSSELRKELPREALTIYNWYTDVWTDNQRNEFLHKLLLKLDPRQHYFIASFLTVRRFKDYISLLPENISMKILGYLPPQDLTNASRVNRVWHRLCNENTLWKAMVDQTRLDIPCKIRTEPDSDEEEFRDEEDEIPVEELPTWKEVYRDNEQVKRKWKSGDCRVIDVRGHKQRVLSVTFNSKQLASGSLDKSICVWDLASGKLVHTLTGHMKGIWCLRFFTENLLISGSYDRTIKVWNLRTGRCDRTLIGHDGPVWCLCVRQYTMLSGSQDKTAKLWDIGRCLLLHTLTGHSAAVFAVDMSEDGSLAITGSADKSVRIWNTESGKIFKVIWLNAFSSVMAVSFSQGYIACSHAGLILLYKLEGKKAKLVRQFHEHHKRVESIKLQIKDPVNLEGLIVSAGKDGIVKHWNVTSSRSVHSFQGHTRRVNCVHFDQLRVATAGFDRKVKIWDFSTE